MPSSVQHVVYDAQEVLQCYGDLVLRTAFMMLKNRADAEDAAQEVFLAFIRTKPEFDSAEHQKACFAVRGTEKHRRWTKRSPKRILPSGKPA